MFILGITDDDFRINRKLFIIKHDVSFNPCGFVYKHYSNKDGRRFNSGYYAKQKRIWSFHKALARFIATHADIF